KLPRSRRHYPADENEGSFDAYPQREPYMAKDRWTGRAPEGAKVAQVLTEIAFSDRQSDASAFLSIAKLAFVMIVTASANDEPEQWKPLLDPHVYKSLEAVISDREERGEVIDQTFIGSSKAELHDGSLVDQRARLTIRFVSELTACTKDRGGHVIEGDPVTI